MKSKCDRCGCEATVHETLIKNGELIEKHLCADCAQDEGIPSQAHPSINELITNYTIAQSGGVMSAKPGLECENCGMKYGQFRKHGLLGCPECYASFESQIGPLIERAHEGATHHVGKRPRRAGGAVDRERRITALRKQLQDAIDAEQYEKAAVLRDQLLDVEDPSDPQHG